MNRPSEPEIDIGFDPLAWLEEPEVSGSETQPLQPKEEMRIPETQINPASPLEEKNVNPLNQDSNERIVNIANYQDISCVTELKTAMQQLLTSNELITLDGREVERIDGAALQLLVAFIRQASDQNIMYQWLEPSPPLKEAAKLAGLDKELGW